MRKTPIMTLSRKIPNKWASLILLSHIRANYGQREMTGNQVLPPIQYTEVPEKHYQSNLIPFMPWYAEDTDLLGQFASFHNHFKAVFPVMVANEERYNSNGHECRLCTRSSVHCSVSITCLATYCTKHKP